MEFQILIVFEAFQCPCCRDLVPTLSLNRLNTQYVKEDLNWLIACSGCHEEAENYYADLWTDYHASRL
jgi:hypothetical protein